MSAPDPMRIVVIGGSVENHGQRMSGCVQDPIVGHGNAALYGLGLRRRTRRSSGLPAVGADGRFGAGAETDLKSRTPGASRAFCWGNDPWASADGCPHRCRATFGIHSAEATWAPSAELSRRPVT